MASISSLRTNGIIPDIIPEDYTPSESVEFTVTFPTTKVFDGEYITPADSAPAPTVTIKGGEEGAVYSVLLVDPDAPSREDPKFGPWRHYIQTGLRATGTASDAPAPHTPWLGPAPPPGTGLHRYVFLLLLEPAGFAPKPLGSEFVDRRSFDVKTWIKENGGKVISSVWFKSKNAEDE